MMNMYSYGKRIYYGLASGKVYQITGELEASFEVTEPTIAEDFETFPALFDREVDSVGLVQLEYGEFQEQFMSNDCFEVDLETTSLIFTPRIFL